MASGNPVCLLILARGIASSNANKGTALVCVRSQQSWTQFRGRHYWWWGINSHGWRLQAWFLKNPSSSEHVGPIQPFTLTHETVPVQYALPTEFECTFNKSTSKGRSEWSEGRRVVTYRRHNFQKQTFQGDQGTTAYLGKQAKHDSAGDYRAGTYTELPVPNKGQG